MFVKPNLCCQFTFSSLFVLTLRIVSKFAAVIVVIPHLKKYLCAYKKTIPDI